MSMSGLTGTGGSLLLGVGGIGRKGGKGRKMILGAFAIGFAPAML